MPNISSVLIHDILGIIFKSFACSSRLNLLVEAWFFLFTFHPDHLHVFSPSHLLTSFFNRKVVHAQVLQWMEDAGTQPSLQMYRNVLSFARRGKSKEYAIQVQERISKIFFF